MTLGFAAILGRLCARWEQRVFYGEDYLIVVVLIALIPFSVIIMETVSFGKNVWELEADHVRYLLKVRTVPSLPHLITFLPETYSIASATFRPRVPLLCRFDDVETLHGAFLHSNLPES